MYDLARHWLQKGLIQHPKDIVNSAIQNELLKSHKKTKKDSPAEKSRISPKILRSQTAGPSFSGYKKYF